MTNNYHYFLLFFSDFKFHACSVNLFSSGIWSDEWFRCVHEKSVQTGKWKNTRKYCTLYLNWQVLFTDDLITDDTWWLREREIVRLIILMGWYYIVFNRDCSKTSLRINNNVIQFWQGSLSVTKQLYSCPVWSVCFSINPASKNLIVNID